MPDPKYGHDHERELLLEEEQELKEPRMFKVLIHNDDYTTMEFVVEVLINIFQKSLEESHRLMLDVHQKGKGIAGLYPYDIAMSKIHQVHALAKVNEYPLKCTCEEA